MKSLQKQIEAEGKFVGKGEVFVEQCWEVHKYDGKNYAVLREVFFGSKLGLWVRVREIESSEVSQYIK